MRLIDFDIGSFLANHWQQTPLLIRNPWDRWVDPLAPDELAGLACEDDVESRLIERRGERWTVEHGPIAEGRFAKLGANPWTLLVQAVDMHVPGVAALLDPFRFIPNWRIDDVMVSYASDGGGVGPHFDQYDVFLIQGGGKRRWQVGARCDAAAELLPNDDLRLLAGFEPQAEWILEPGDILYLPPRFAHNGVAAGDGCMTYSIGFRAPSRSELAAHWTDHVLAALDDDDRYGDPGLAVQDNPGEIAPAALDRLHEMVLETLRDRDAFARWFGTYSSAAKYPDLDWRPGRAVRPQSLRKRLSAGAGLVRNPASRFAFIRRGGGVLLFVDGECFECTAEAAVLAEALCAAEVAAPGAEVLQSDSAMALAADLCNRGCLSVAKR